MKKRILFVDDEPNVLSGLQRMLRSMREEWEMVLGDHCGKARTQEEHISLFSEFSGL